MLAPSSDRFAFKAPRYSETWSVKPISESKSSARCCAFVVLDNNLMASSSCRDLCVRRVAHESLQPAKDSKKATSGNHGLLDHIVRAFHPRVSFIRERKKNRLHGTSWSFTCQVLGFQQLQLLSNALLNGLNSRYIKLAHQGDNFSWSSGSCCSSGTMHIGVAIIWQT